MKLVTPQLGSDFIRLEFLDTTMVAGGLLNTEARLIIGGETGTGKSFLALQLMAEASLGNPWLGIWPVLRPFQCAVIQTEVSEAMFQDRMRRLNHEVPVGGLWVVTQRDYQVEELAAETRVFMDSVGIEIACFDPLYQMHSADENSVQAIRPVQKAFDSMMDKTRALVIVHHMRKPGVDGAGPVGLHSLRGSSAWPGWADTVMVMVGKSGAEFVWLHVVKARNRNEGMPRAVKLAWHKPGRFFVPVTMESESRFADVMEIVGEVTITKMDLTKALIEKGYSRSAAYRAVEAAQEVGLLVGPASALGLDTAANLPG